MSSYRDRQNLVLNDPLSRGQMGAAALSGNLLRRNGQPVALNVPETYRPLAGLEQNQRGQNILVDSTMFGQISPRTGQSSAARTTVVQTRSPGDDAEMLTVTLAFGYQTPLETVPDGDDAASLVVFDQRIFCLLTWGIGGAEYNAIVDWMKGTVLTLSANYLRVVALVPDNSGVAVPSAVPAFRLTASIAYGQVPGRPNRAKLTTNLGLLADGASVVVAIPDFAVGYDLALSSPIGGVGAPYVPAPFIITQFDFDTPAATVTASHLYGTGSNIGTQSPHAFPVLNGARFLRLGNISGQEAVVNVLWDMVL